MTIRGNVIAYAVAGALIMATMAASIHYIQLKLHDAVSAQTEAVISQLAKTQARVDDIENTLARLETAIDGPAPEFSTHVVRNADLQARLDGLEQQLAEMGGPDIVAADVSEPANHQSLAEALQDQLLERDNPTNPPSLADIFSEDRGSSKWGEANIARVSEEYAQEPWFQQYGGELTTRCRRTSCKVEWVVPAVEPDDHAFALAEYELMAAATRNTDQIDRVQTDRRTEAGRAVISVFFQRR